MVKQIPPLCFGRKRRPAPALGAGLTAAGHEKRRPPASVPRPFLLVLTVLSMTILTYMDLRFKGKTLPKHCQFYASISFHNIPFSCYQSNITNSGFYLRADYDIITKSVACYAYRRNTMGGLFMDTKKENPYLKRAFLYLPISIMSIIYGILHAIKASAISVGFIQCVKYVGLAVPLLLDNILFLTFYTQTFRGNEKLPNPPIKEGTQNSIGYVCCIQMFALIIISNYYSLAYALVIACFSAITVISCILMNKKATQWVKEENPLKQQKVRLELIWPSLYVVALSIVSGYFLVISESSSMDAVASIPIVLPMVMATLYAITMFFADDYKRKDKEALHPAHIIFLALLFFFAALSPIVKMPLNNGKTLFPFQHMRLLAWSVVISAVFAQFEAWAVVERRRNDKDEIKRYIKSANIVTVALLFLLPVAYAFSYGADISPFYMVGFSLIGCIYLVIRISCLQHKAEDEYEYIPNEKNVREVKIFLTALCMAFLVISEILPDDIVVWFKDVLSNRIPLVLSILSGISFLAIVVRQIIKKEAPVNKSTLNLMLKLSSYETTENLCKQVLYWSLFGASGCFIIMLALQEYNKQLALIFPYKLSMTFIHYVVIALVCLLVSGVEFVQKLNSENKTPEEPGSHEDITPQNAVDTKERVKKIFELLHIPSSTMIFLLIFVPSIINSTNFFTSFIKSLPLTFIATAGFALNNYMDAEKDLINKPNRAIPSGTISKQFAMSLCVLLYFISTIILFAFSQSLFETLICIVAGLGTIFYSLCAKRIGYVKTLITGLLTITPFLIVFYYYDPGVNEFLFLTAVVLSTIGKELLMDVRDMSGDAAVGQFTIATLLGERITQTLSICISSLAIVFYLFSYQFAMPLSLGLISVAIGILIVSYKIWFSASKHKHEFGIYLLWGVIAICSLPILV